MFLSGREVSSALCDFLIWLIADMSLFIILEPCYLVRYIHCNSASSNKSYNDKDTLFYVQFGFLENICSASPVYLFSSILSRLLEPLHLVMHANIVLTLCLMKMSSFCVPYEIKYTFIEYM